MFETGLKRAGLIGWLVRHHCTKKALFYTFVKYSIQKAIFDSSYVFSQGKSKAHTLFSIHGRFYHSPSEIRLYDSCC